jgi:hypothetical protein
MTSRRRNLAFVLPTLLLLAACGAEKAPEAAPVAAPARPQVPAARVTVAQFKSMTWLVGRWRGTLNDTMPYYEGYRYANDSSLATYSFTDSTLRTPKVLGQILLRGGKVTNGEEGSAGWFVVTAIDSNSVHFEPRGQAMNAYTWKRGPRGSWSATLTWNDAAGRPMERTYQMKRLDGPK